MKAYPRLFLWKKWLIASAGVVLFGLFAAYLAVSLWIGSDVRSIAAEAKQAYQGDRVEALIALVDDQDHRLEERNRAVWALGQLGDSRALPVLEKHQTGRPCDHSAALCQREINKAINLAGGGVNVTAIVWRRLSVGQEENSGQQNTHPSKHSLFSI